MNRQSFGQFVKERREHLYPSQKACAEAAEMSASHLWQIENARIAVPRPPLRRRLARALSVRHVDLLVAAEELTEDEVAPSPRLGLPPRKALLIQQIEEALLDDEDLASLSRRVAEDHGVNLRRQQPAPPPQSGAPRADGRAGARAGAAAPAAGEDSRPSSPRRP